MQTSTTSSCLITHALGFSLQEALKPYIMACESKSAKLASMSLVSLQRLLAHNMLAADELLIAIQALEQVQLLPCSFPRYNVLVAARCC